MPPPPGTRPAVVWASPICASSDGDDQVAGQRQLEAGRRDAIPLTAAITGTSSASSERQVAATRVSTCSKYSRSPKAASSSSASMPVQKTPSRTADHERAHALVALHAGDDVVEVVERLLGEAVPVGTRERRVGDAILLVA